METDPLDAVADTLLGVPFVHGGTEPEYGLDCYGLVLAFYRRAFGVELPPPVESPAYADFERLGASVPELLSGWAQVPDGKQRPGDAVLLALAPGVESPSHVGVVLPRGFFLHASRGQGVIRSPLAFFGRRVRGYARHGSREA